MMQTIPALSVVDLGTGYANERSAIHNVSFDVLPGERIGLLGPNGAGKSTLFKAIAGLLPYNSGRISIHGEDCRTSHHLVGYVPQHEAIDWNFPVTVNDVVMMGRTRKIGFFRWAHRHDHEVVRQCLRRVGMSDLEHRQIGQLSGGQKRRVFIARALAQETDVLLLDEPFSGVDAAAEEEIFATLDDLKTMGVTVLLATHDLGTVTERFDKLLLIKRTVLGFGTPQEVFKPDLLKTAYGGQIGVFEENGRSVIIADEHRG